MRIDILTPFPKMFEGFLGESILKKAQDKGIVIIKICDLRDFTEDKHKTVDDYPYGGGSGMILKPEPIFRAIDELNKETDRKSRLLFMTPQGEPFTQEKAKVLSQEEHLTLICGHYRGVDERVVEALEPEEISIGDYVLTGGELAAAVVVDAVVRLIPGVLGDSDSAEGDSFTSNMLDHPHYTRPEEFRGMRVPEILLSGHHAKIDTWRKEQAHNRTQRKRPDLLDENIK